MRHGEVLSVRLSGVGWKWVDQANFGFGVHKYVFFEATTTLAGRSDAHYDPQKRVLSIWYSPLSSPRVAGQSLVRQALSGVDLFRHDGSKSTQPAPHSCRWVAP
jgi:hypothetical protein